MIKSKAFFPIPSAFQINLIYFYLNLNLLPVNAIDENNPNQKSNANDHNATTILLPIGNSCKLLHFSSNRKCSDMLDYPVIVLAGLLSLR